MATRAAFGARLRAREPLAGTFMKSRDPAHVEILGHAGFDFVILDAEHSAFDRGDIAVMAIAARAARIALLVRIPVPDGGWIATALDAGCAGIVAPQVTDAGAAERLAAAMRYGSDGRGFSPSTPGAEYGRRSVAEHLARSAEEAVLICQIEDETAVAGAGAIAALDGVDGLLLGPVDLAVSLGTNDPAGDDVTEHCRRAIDAGALAGKAAGLFLSDIMQRRDWHAAGATLFVLGSDQGFLLGAARAALEKFRRLV